jgi:hypothetical protein
MHDYKPPIPARRRRKRKSSIGATFGTKMAENARQCWTLEFGKTANIYRRRRRRDV